MLGGWGGLKEFLSHIFVVGVGWEGGGSYVPCQKRLHKIKYGYEGSTSNVDVGLCVSQATN